MEKEFVSYEIALKLKELGFDEPCIAYYFNRYGDVELFSEFVIDHSKMVFYTHSEYETIAPLWQQCVDWLETKGYYINITRVFQWSPLPIEFLGWCIHIGTENPEEQLECNLYYVSHYYPTKQEAREQAILKCIELCQKEK